MAKILLVEDDRRLSALLARRLSEEGHRAETAATGLEGLRRSLSDGYDVLILDRMLPGLDGVSVAGELRAQGVDVPILMLTARDTVEDRVSGLRGGADDYLVNPFAFEEPLAGGEALSRRSDADRTLTYGALRVEPLSRRAFVDGAG